MGRPRDHPVPRGGGVLLFAVPERTGELFAWAIAPPLSAYLLASAYVGGIWFFVRVAVARRWHHARRGFPAVVVFAGALLIATLLHLEKFSQNLSFVVWIALYATTPFVVAFIAFVQRRHDPGTPGGRMPSSRVSGVRAEGIGRRRLAAGAAVFVAPAARGSDVGMAADPAHRAGDRCLLTSPAS